MRRLALSRETLRVLDDRSLGLIVGGEQGIGGATYGPGKTCIIPSTVTIYTCHTCLCPAPNTI